jgi:nitroreductase
MQNHPVFENIFERRSIRSYLPAPVEKDKLELIMKAAIWAPSASNYQTWHFTVIQDKSVIDKINALGKEFLTKSDRPEYVERGNDPNYSVFHGAPCLILVSHETARRWGKIDTALASQNIMLAAHALGLGTCYIGMLTPWLEGGDAQPLLATLPIPQGYAAFHFITLGTPAATTAKRDRREGTVSYL